MTGPVLRQLVGQVLAPAPPEAGSGLAQVHAGAAETLLWLQPAPDAIQLARAHRARSGQFEAFGQIHALGDPPRWKADTSISIQWLRAIHQLPMLVDLAQAWSAQRDPEDLAAWARIAERWLSTLAIGELAGDGGQAEAGRIGHGAIALLVLRRAGALQQLPSTLLPRLLERIGREIDHVLRHLKATGSERSLQLYAAYLAASVLGPCLPRRGRSLAAVQARQARELLVANLVADFRGDGSHCEGSPQLHRRTLQMALSFVALARALDHALPPPLHARLRAALEFSLWSTLPDGGLPGAEPDAPSNRDLLALGAALYWLPSLEFGASGGGRGEPPDALSRHFSDAGQLVARSSWHDAQAQHLFHDCGAAQAGAQAPGDQLAFCYTIAGRKVLVDPGQQRSLPGASRTLAQEHEAQPLVRLGARSLVVRTSATAQKGPTHTRCLAYVLRRYVLVVDRFHTADAHAHPACLTLQFAPDWQDRLALQQDARGIVVSGMGPRPCADWQVLLDAPGASVDLAEGSGSTGPRLRAQQDFRDETVFAAAIGPQGSGFAIHGLEARHGAGRSVVCVTGESEGEAFVDRLVVHWHEPGLVMRSDYLARAPIALERRCAGKLQHLLLAQTTDWFPCLQPVHAPRAPDAAGGPRMVTAAQARVACSTCATGVAWATWCAG